MNGSTAFLLDKFAFDRIERLVRRYEKQMKDVQQQQQQQQRGGGVIDKTMKLTPEAYANLNTSNMRADLDDPSSVSGLLGGESKGVSAIRRAQALIKLFADHMCRDIKLPRGWNIDYIRREIKKLLTNYGADIKRNLGRVETMDRKTAINILAASIDRNNTSLKNAADENTERLTGSIDNSNELLQALLRGQEDLLNEQRHANFKQAIGSTPFTPGLAHTVRDFEYDDDVRIKKYPSTEAANALDVSLSPQSYIQQAYDAVSQVRPNSLVPDSGVDTLPTMNNRDSDGNDRSWLLKQLGFGHGRKQRTQRKPVFTKRWKPIIC